MLIHILTLNIHFKWNILYFSAIQNILTSKFYSAIFKRTPKGHYLGRLSRQKTLTWPDRPWPTRCDSHRHKHRLFNSLHKIINKWVHSECSLTVQDVNLRKITFCLRIIIKFAFRPFQFLTVYESFLSVQFSKKYGHLSKKLINGLKSLKMKRWKNKFLCFWLCLKTMVL